MSQLTNYLEKSYPIQPFQTALYSNGLTQLARDQSKINANPYIFNHEVTPKFSITDQKSSGRCWLFATLNMLRIVAAQNFDVEPKELEFSQTYLYFWDKLERYHRAIRYYLDIKKNVQVEFQIPYLNHLYKEAMGDGGQWDMAKELVVKYGIVPKQAMPDSHHSKASGGMNGFLLDMLKNDFTILSKSDESAHEELIKMMVDRVYKFLVGFLGQPPKQFDWVFNSKEGVKTFVDLTPHKLLEMTKFNPNDWISVVHDPRKENPYNKYYQVQYLGNVKDQHVGWLNLPIERLKELTAQSINANKPVWFGCNVGADRDRESGIMDVQIHNYKDAFGWSNKMTKEEKLKTYLSLPSHAMVIVGYYDSDGKIKRWKIENSWGSSSGTNGFLLMTDQWYDEYVYQIVVPKSLLTENEINELNTVSKLIAPWDPLGTLA
jgi:bleomycin hydrolase